MASIYDNNFMELFQKYRNKQRLTGRQLDPNVVGSLAEADLNARYTDQRSRKAQDIQQDAIDKNYDIYLKRLDQEKLLADQAAKAQKKAGLYIARGSSPVAGITAYKLGKELGWWGKGKEKDVNTPISLYSDNIQWGGPTGNYSGDAWGDPFTTSSGGSTSVNTGNSSSGIWDWVSNLFKGWF